MLKKLRKKRSKRPLVLHPLLFVVYAVLSLIATNVAWVSVEGLQGLLITVFIILILLPVMILIFRDPEKTGLLSSVAILLILSYSHIKALTQDWQIAGFSIGQPLILISLGLLLFGLWVYVVFRKLTDIKRVAQYFTIVGLLLLIFPSFTIGSYVFQISSVKGQGLSYSAEEWQRTGGMAAEQQISLQEGEQRDIYYIILDGYTRQDTLMEVFDYDNAWFVEALRERGFYVANASQSNYSRTTLSMSSSLNMVHIDGLPDHLVKGTQINGVWSVEVSASEMLTQNRITHLLRQEGYEIVDFDTGLSGQEFENVDHRLISPELEGGEYDLATAFDPLVTEVLFGQFLRDVTPGEGYDLLQQDLFDAHRLRVEFTMEEIDSFAREDGNYFVYAHVISPHPPFVFGPDGEEITGVQAYNLSSPDIPFDEIVLGYRDQVHYLNSLVLDAVDRILAESQTPPIIILQGDHGSRHVPIENWEDDVQGFLDSYFPILNAYYLPDVDTSSLYPTISPVNSFRLVMNQYFGTDLEYLEDLSFMDTFAEAKFEFAETCKEFDYCLEE